MIRRQWILILLLVVGICGHAWSDASQVAALRAVSVSATELPGNVQGLPLDKLSLASWNGHAFIPIPFQIDELDQLGMVWFKGKSPDDLDGKPGVLDGHDQLWFMWQDAGQAAPAAARPARGKLLTGLSLSLPGLANRYIYLLYGDPARDHRGYVSQDMHTGLTATDYYQLKVNPQNELDWYSLLYDGYKGQGSIISGLRMRMSARFITRLSPRITLDNSNLKPILLADKRGPIRSIMLLKIHVVLLNIPVMTIYEQVSRYASRYQAVTYTRIPRLYRDTLKDPHVAVSIVGQDQMGATLSTALTDGQQVRVDGQMDSREKLLMHSGITARKNWVYFNSQRNFIMLTRLDLPSSLQTVPLSLVYQDQAATAGKPASLPNVGYAIMAWPRERELHFSLDMLFDNSLHGVTPEQYLALRLGKVTTGPYSGNDPVAK